MAWVLGHSRLGLLVFGCLLFLGLPAVANATDRYVSNAPGAVGTAPGTGCATGQAGYAGIQDAIDAATSGDLIFVCPGTYADGPWTVTDKNLTFQGAGDGTDPALNTIIDGDSVRDGFRIATASGTPVPLSAAFTGFRFVDNVAPNATDAVGGSAIRPIGANVTLALTTIDSTFTGNSTPDGTEDPGGAIFAEDLTVTGSTFSINYSDDEGGAVYATDSLVVTDSTFTGNEAESDNGGAAVGGEVTITDSTFTGNFISDAETTDNGGAVWAESATVTGSDFDSNTTLPTDAANTYGGAIYSDGGVDVEDSTFTENVASDGGGAIHGADGDDGSDVTGSTFTGNIANQFLVEDQEGAGGAIFWSDDPTYELEVVDSVFGGPASGDGNQSRYGGAIRSGGAIIVRGTGAEGTESRFEANLSAGAGGAIRCGGDCASTTVTDTAFIGNSAIGVDEFDPAADGGAIGTGAVTGAAIPLLVEDSTFTSNISLADGGAIAWDEIGDVTILDSNFTTNQAGADGGAVAADTTGFEFVVDGSTFDRNSNTDSGVESEADGGALYIDLGEATPSLGDFGGFVVASDFVGNSSEDDGGAIYVSRGNLYVGDGSGPFSVGPESVTGCPEFSGNEASDDGGAIYQSGRALGLLICDAGGEGGEEILFADNVAGGDGGAIRWGPTQTSLDEFWGFLSYGASLTGNEAGGSGGAIRAGFIYEALATRFDQNLAESGDGGAISALVAELEGSEMTRNSAVNGGAISASGIGIGDGRVEGNRALGDGAAGGDGGGLHAPAPSEEAFGPEASGFVQLEFVELDGNTATGDGGAAMVEGVSQVLASTITGNRAAGEGGGLATYKSTPSSGSFAVAAALATTFDSNQAVRGGAVYSEEAAFSGAGSGPSSTTHGDYREALGKEAGLPGIPNDLLSTMGLKRLRDRIDLEEEFEVRNGPGDDGSTFSNNSASESGSAISARAFASLVNSTVTGNRGPAAVEVTDPDAEALVVENVTVAGNDPQAGPVLSVPAAILASVNSIVSEEGSACAFGSSESLGGNAVSTRTSGCDSLVGGPAPSLQTPISPVQIGLEPLADNGGYTETMGLSGRSIALSTALAEACPPQDQRGVARDPLTCDPGAYEYIGPLDPILGVEKLGTGTGTVSTDPSGIDCGETCALRYPADGVVTLTATPTDGSTFTGWTGAGCSGTGSCQVTMTRARTVEATFTAGPGPGQGVRVRKFRQGTNRVPGNRKVRIARVSCLVGNCEIESAKVTFLARRKSFGGRVVVPSRSLEAGESVVISSFMPKKAFRRLSRTRTGVASLLVEVDSSNQTAVLRGVRIGLKRGGK